MRQNNRKASFEYTFIDTYTAGIVLIGAEIKQITANLCNISDAYCYIKNNEVFIKGMHVNEYKQSSLFSQYEPKRERKLLLNRNEIDKISEKLGEKGLTLIVKSIFINEKGKCKLEICLAKGKKLYDKRESLKQKDLTRQLKKKDNE